MDTAKACAYDRASICTEHLRVPVKIGKKILHEVLRRLCTFVACQWSIYKKLSAWRFHCAGWHAVCSERRTTSSRVCRPKFKRNPEASLLFYLYACIEDFIMSAWEAAAVSLKPKHLSLHFDGIRLMGHTTDMSLDELCTHFSHEIKVRTGFNVRIVVKTHRSFAELCFADTHVQQRDDIHPIMRESGNCIPLAVSLAMPSTTSFLTDYLQQDVEANANAKRFKSKSYESVMKATKLHAVPSTGLQIEAGGKYLLHMENGGHPHCLACVVDENGEAMVMDAKGHRSMSLMELRAMAVDAIDAASLVTFRLYQDEERRRA